MFSIFIWSEGRDYETLKTMKLLDWGGDVEEVGCSRTKSLEYLLFLNSWLRSTYSHTLQLTHLKYTAQSRSGYLRNVHPWVCVNVCVYVRTCKYTCGFPLLCVHNGRRDTEPPGHPDLPLFSNIADILIKSVNFSCELPELYFTWRYCLKFHNKLREKAICHCFRWQMNYSVTTFSEKVSNIEFTFMIYGLLLTTYKCLAEVS